MTQECRHISRSEAQSDEDFRKLSRWTRSTSPRLVAVDELRLARLARLTGHMDAVSVGVDRPSWSGEARALDKGVMETQDGRGVRLSCRKFERLVAPRRRVAGGERRVARAAQVINHEELEAALASFKEAR